MGLRLVTHGRNRCVLLTSRYAIKLPAFHSWQSFLFGLLNNMNERDWQAEHSAYCPIIWAAPLGLALIMPRVAELDDQAFDAAAHEIPHAPGAERKASSWGYLDGRLVAIDYGWR